MIATRFKTLPTKETKNPPVAWRVSFWRMFSRQRDIKVIAVIESRSVRVTPPNSISHQRE